MEFILVGQPNSGKSTIFNSVIGYKSVASNFPGVSNEYTSGSMKINDASVTVVDLPGIYSLQTTDEAEEAALEYLMNASAESVIVNVLDASVLSRSLELTLQLLELRHPMMVVLNMMDEAQKKHLKIDVEKLSGLLGVPVVPVVARRGEGVFSIFYRAYKAEPGQLIPGVIKGPSNLSGYIDSMAQYLQKKKIPTAWDKRLLVLKLLEYNTFVENYLKIYLNSSDWVYLYQKINEIEKIRGARSDQIVSAYRHNMAFKIFEEAVTVGKLKKKDIRVKIDNILMHPVLGYLALLFILASAFFSLTLFANSVDSFLSGIFEDIISFASRNTDPQGLLFQIIRGFVDGFGGGIIISFSYLFPFFVILSVLEDTGYLARVAYLIDNIMHKIGLHGMSVVPMILGYGCTVPAIIGTRILKSKRDRLITSVLITLIPCSARMVIILGLVGALFSVEAAILFYFINIIVVGITGKIMSKAMPEVTPGLVMEIPRYHLPAPKMVLKKTWFRLREFIIIAWPLLIVGSIIMELIGHFKFSDSINSFLSPFTSGILGLPAAVGVVLLFGILRKELALVLLAAALGAGSTGAIRGVMTDAQIYTFVVFASYYIPCLATIAALIKEFKLKKALLTTLFTFLLAIALSLLVRLIFLIF